MNNYSSFNLKNLRPHPRGAAYAFEDLCCYLFKRQSGAPVGAEFRRHGQGPDGGVEAIYKLPDGKIWGIQAKYIMDFNIALGEFEKSLGMTLTVHSDLSKYIISVPYMLTGNRKGRGGKIAQGMWEKYENWKKSLKKEVLKGKNVEVELWSEEELQSKFISLDESGGLYEYWFGELYFTDQWFSEQFRDASAQARERYSPELHMDTPLVEKFQFFGQTSVLKEKLEQLSKDCMECFISWKKSIEQGEIPKIELGFDLASIEDRVVKISQNLIHSLERPGILIEPNFKSLVVEIVDKIREIENGILKALLKLHGNSADTPQFRQFSANYSVSFPMEPLDRVRELKEILELIKELSIEEIFDLSANKTLLIRGEAGIGKTHGIVDLVRQRSDQAMRSLVFFGGDFGSNDPWDTMIKHLGLPPIGSKRFLEALNVAGENSGYPLILFIDALNESDNRSNWLEWLPRLCAAVESYPYLRLCVSCRENYVRQVVPNLPNICSVRHNGFMGLEIEAQKRYSVEYKTGEPKHIYFHKEFSNPLFLRLYFESLKMFQENMTTDEYENVSSHIDINSMIANWLKFKNEKVLKLLKIDPRGKNLVRMALDTLANIMIEHDSREISLESFQNGLTIEYGQNSGEFLQTIEDESLISVVAKIAPGFAQETEYFVRFTFERIGDFLIAENLITSTSDLVESLKPSNSLYKYVEDDNAILEHSGVLEALSVRWPEVTGRELIDCVDCKNHPELRTHFISSLYWRNPSKISDRTKELMWELLGENEYVVRGFECLFELSTIKSHSLNAEYLHNFLIDQNMAVHRDGYWAYVLGQSFSGWSSDINIGSPVQKLSDVDNFLKTGEISDVVSILWATITCWFFASPDRRIRDRATKTLTAILYKKPSIALELLTKFKNCDDEYITERLFVAIYGAFLLNRSSEYATKISKYLLENYCTTDQWPLNVSIRDHIRLILELSISLDSSFKIGNLSEIQTMISDVQPIIDLSKDLEKPVIDEKKIPNLDIGKLYGMNFNTDFGIYVVKSSIEEIVGRDPNNHDIDFKNLNNGFLNAVLKLGYPGEGDRCANFDNLILGKFGSLRGNPGWAERLGKKYNWIILKQFLGQLIDQKRLSSDDNSFEPENFLQGVNLRDIDSTDLRLNFQKSEKNQLLYSAKAYTAPAKNSDLEKWCITDDFGSVLDFVEIRDSNESKYCVINVRNNWDDKVKSDKYAPYRYVHMKFNGALIKGSDLKILVKEFKKDYSDQSFDFYNEPTDYLGYLGEWCDFGPFSLEADNPMELIERRDQPEICFLSGQLLRESDWDQDYSSPNIIKPLYVPSPKLIKYGELKWNNVGEWVNSKGEPILVNPWWNSNGRLSGLIGSVSFIDRYLQENDEEFVVFCFQEKTLISFKNDYERIIIETMLKLKGGKFETVERKVRKW